MKKSIYDFTVKNLRGEDIALETYRGRVLLVVNTASGCGLTPQLGELQAVYDEFKARGFEILGFPSNDFASQEPLSGEEISNFCDLRYRVRYPVFDKIHVKGAERHPLYAFLGAGLPFWGSTPRWNFHKFLINRQGEVVDYFLPVTSPTSDKLKRAIEQELAKAE